MAEKGSKKELSVRQENKIAKLYDGAVSPSSGGAKSDKGDIRCTNLLIEAKMTTSKPPAWIKQFEKITEEAYGEGREPAMAFRWYEPESILADADGWIDLVVRRAAEDALRESEYEDR